MVKFQVTRGTAIVKTKSIEGGEITVYTELTAGDVDAINKLDLQKNKDKIFAPFELIIKEWNFEDEAGNPVPVTESNIKILFMSDLEAIQDISGLPKVDKKDVDGFLDKSQ